MKYDKVFLIGNGPSRKDFDLNILKNKGYIVGCNAIYRDFTPDLLSIIDSKMLNEVKRNSVNIPILHRNNFRTKCFNSSGIFALRYIMQELQPNVCYLIGMDFAPGNIYFATSNYRNILKMDWNTEKSFFIKALKQYPNINICHVLENKIFNLDPHIFKYRRITYREFENEI